jgi:single-strand DNA-binding protein
MSFCEIILVGNVGRDPEPLRYTGSGMAVTSFSMAVSRSRRVNDQWVDDTTWFKVTAWAQLAERVVSQVKKGQQILVAADRIEANAYLTKDTHEARASLDVTARQVRLLGKRDGEVGGAMSGGPSDQDDYMRDLGDAPTDVNDIPF